VPKSRAETIFCIIASLLMAAGFGGGALFVAGNAPTRDALESIRGQVSGVEAFGGYRGQSGTRVWLGDTQLNYGSSRLASQLPVGSRIEARVFPVWGRPGLRIYELGWEGRELVSYEREMRKSRLFNQIAAGISFLLLLLAVFLGRHLRRFPSREREPA